MKGANFKSHIYYKIIFKNSETTKPNHTLLRDIFVCGKIIRKNKENSDHYIQFSPQGQRTCTQFWGRNS